MERNVSLDILKLIMAFMVVGLHAGFLGDITQIGQHLTVQGLFRIAVPVFLLINGYYFFQVLSRKNSGLWFKRVFILYIVWMLIYSFFWFYVPDFSLKSITLFTLKILFGYHHLWYISGMIGAALILVFSHKLPSFFLIIISLTFFFIGVLIQYLGNYHVFEGKVIDEVFNLNWSHRNSVFFAFPFLCLGYLIHKHSIIDKVNLKITSIGCFLGLFLLFIESYFNYVNIGEYSGFDNYLSLIIVCPFIFLFASKINIKGKSKNIALYSSSIYFIHALVLLILAEFSQLEETSLTFWAVLCSVIASYFIIEINKKVKVML
ncbi:acyltransferase family protein [Vibrio sp. Of7-15]|uniref:acyltransferase family protein n=1 Tax=Vibrio sp. Of7-15 TaxID=2724879 RepID=UPI001EF2267A|nr:acyltransferase [Vibrio sp. Of7-15]MCG7499685.1 acyltransferase family protein [Vibrio sp. Of7-15]